MRTKVYSDYRGEGAVILNEHRFRIPSFTDPRASYLTDVAAGYCGCPHHSRTGARCKHIILSAAIRELYARSVVTGSAEETLRGMCLRIYRPITTDYRRSYDLFLEVAAYRYRTPELIEAARLRHVKTLAKAGYGKEAA